MKYGVVWFGGLFDGLLDLPLGFFMRRKWRHNSDPSICCNTLLIRAHK